MQFPTISNKRKPIIIAVAACVFLLLLVLSWLLFPGLYKRLGVPQDIFPCGKYTGYDVVVVAKNTPDEVVAELEKYQIDYIEYKAGRILLGDGGMIDETVFHGEPKIYLCSGEYEAELGNFIRYTGKEPLTIHGDKDGKTVIAGGSKLYASDADGICIAGTLEQTLEQSVIENVAVEGFGCGVRLKYADKTVLRQVTFKENHENGLLFENTSDCDVSDCIFEENGNPLTDDIGYGICLLYNSRNNVVNAVYKNNGNQNAVDFPARPEKELPEDNTLNLKQEYDIKPSFVPVRDSKEEAQIAKPTSKAQRFELEKAKIDNTGAVFSDSTQNVEKFSGSGWVFLFNTKITLDFNVKEAGNYRIYVIGTSDDGNNKCDFFQVNGGEKYLTSFMGKSKGVWQTCQPGTESWENDELHPTALTDGFELKAGKNRIEITANWGYCCYDAILVEKIQ